MDIEEGEGLIRRYNRKNMRKTLELGSKEKAYVI